MSGPSQDDSDRERQAIADALGKIAGLIRRVIVEKDLSVRFANPNLRRCYEVTACAKTACPCYGGEAKRCWQIVGTYAEGRQPCAVSRFRDSCDDCPVFKLAAQDPIYQIGEYFNNMMQMLEAKNAELREAYTELKSAHMQVLQQEKMASIGQLAAGVAHEINNPLGFIMSNLGSLRRYLGSLTEFISLQARTIDLLAPASAGGSKALDELSASRRSFKIDAILEDAVALVNESREGADRVKKIVQDLRKFCRLDEAELKRTDINADLESTINILGNELRNKAIVKKDFGELPQTLCYAGQLNQVFMNILMNAAQAIEERGEIAIRTRRENDSIVATISDTGCGIRPEDLGRIFDPFFTTREVGKGIGLGLTTAYEIVKKHNGAITVQSEFNKGTTVTVSIPVVEK